MDIKITKNDGKVFTLSRLGVTATDCVVTSAPLRTSYDSSGELDGVIDGSVTLGQRLIVIPFFFDFKDEMDFVRKRDKLNAALTDRNTFHVEELRNNTGKQYAFVDTVAGYNPSITPLDKNYTAKRYCVRLQGGVEYEQGYRIAKGEITLETVRQSVAESVNEVIRSYDTAGILFDNQGSETIDMRHQNETEITFTGASTGLTITNETTGDVWRYTGSTAAGDTILLKGVQSFKNGVSIFRDTNKKLLTFAPGVNKLTIGGAPSVNLTIRTRFYFL